MVKMNYPGIVAPEEELAKLLPAYKTLREWQMKCRPSGPEYHSVCVAIEGLDNLALRLTNMPMTGHDDVIAGSAGEGQRRSIETAAAERTKAARARG